MVLATLRLVIPASKRGEVLQALRSLRGPTEAHTGCEGFYVYRFDDDENSLLLLQAWATQAALTCYLKSDFYRTILAIMETASEPPEVRFDTIAHTAGVELVEAARSCGRGLQ